MSSRPSNSSFLQDLPVELVIELGRAQLTVADLAAEVGLNPNYLIQSFSKARGVSPHKYLIFKKVCRAKKMIAEGTPPLDAALALGFYDQAHFIRHFRKVMGVTPGRMVVHRAS